MNREETIQYLLDNMFINSTSNNYEWEMFLSQMTDDELKAIAKVNQLEDADMLTKGDLEPLIKVIEKYMPGSVGVVYEDHDPEVDLWENAGNN